MGHMSPRHSRASAWCPTHSTFMAVATHVCFLVATIALLTTVDAHGYLSKPVSRNYYENLQSRFWNRE